MGKKLSRAMRRSSENIVREISNGEKASEQARESAAELQRFEPSNGVALIRDDLGLPNQTEGHQAHEEHADSEGEVCVSFSRRQTKGANEPGHV